MVAVPGFASLDDMDDLAVADAAEACDEQEEAEEEPFVIDGFCAEPAAEDVPLDISIDDAPEGESAPAYSEEAPMEVDEDIFVLDGAGEELGDVIAQEPLEESAEAIPDEQPALLETETAEDPAEDDEVIDVVVQDDSIRPADVSANSAPMKPSAVERATVERQPVIGKQLVKDKPEAAAFCKSSLKGILKGKGKDGKGKHQGEHKGEYKGEHRGEHKGEAKGEHKGKGKVKGKGKSAGYNAAGPDVYHGLIHTVGAKTGNMLVRSWKATEKFGQEVMIPAKLNTVGAVVGDKVSFEVVEGKAGGRPLAMNVVVRGHVDKIESRPPPSAAPPPSGDKLQQQTGEAVVSEPMSPVASPAPAPPSSNDTFYAGVVSSSPPQLRGGVPRRWFVHSDAVSSQSGGKNAWFLDSQRPDGVEAGSLVVFTLPIGRLQVSFVAPLAPIGNLKLPQQGLPKQVPPQPSAALTAKSSSLVQAKSNPLIQRVPKQPAVLAKTVVRKAPSVATGVQKTIVKRAIGQRI